MSEGWIKLHRNMIKWEWFSDPKTSHFMVYCLLKASHKKTQYKGKNIPKGGFWFGRKRGSIETGLSEQSIRTALNHLKSTNEITIKPSPQGSIIIINNWDKYQQTNSELTNDQPTINQRSTTYKNVKNVKNVKNRYSEEFSDLFPDLDIKSWTQSNGSKKLQDSLVQNYDHTILKEEIEKAYYWQLENGKRNAGLFIKSWMDRCNNPLKVNPALEDKKALAFLAKLGMTDDDALEVKKRRVD